MMMSVGTARLARGFSVGRAAAAKGGTVYKWIDNLFNGIDRSRVKQLGADRVAAEFVLRMDGKLRIGGKEEWIRLESELPEKGKVKVEEIDLSSTALSDAGMQHFNELEHLKSVSVADCGDVDDEAINFFLPLPLEKINVSGCNFTSHKLKELGTIGTLQHVTMKRMPLLEGRDIADIEKALKDRLGNVTVDA